MSQHYFKARRKRGACYGSLWKQHSSSNTPPNIMNSLYSFKEVVEEEEIGGYGGDNGNDFLNLMKETNSTTTCSTNNSTSTTTSNNNNNDKRKTGKGKTVITVGLHDSSSSSSTTTNNNSNSIMSTAGVETLTAALEKNDRAKCYEFCVLIGNTLTGYENLTAFRRGDHPTVSKILLLLKIS